MKLDTTIPAEERALYKVVRTDTFVDIAGLIISADDATGECITLLNDKNESYNFGPGGMRIVRR